MDPNDIIRLPITMFCVFGCVYFGFGIFWLSLRISDWNEAYKKKQREANDE